MATLAKTPPKSPEENNPYLKQLQCEGEGDAIPVSWWIGGAFALTLAAAPLVRYGTKYVICVHRSINWFIDSLTDC